MKSLFERLMRKDVQKLILKTAESHAVYWLSVGGLALSAVLIKLADGEHAAGIAFLALYGIDHSYRCVSDIQYLRSVVYNNDQARGMDA